MIKARTIGYSWIDIGIGRDRSAIKRFQASADEQGLFR